MKAETVTIFRHYNCNGTPDLRSDLSPPQEGITDGYTICCIEGNAIILQKRKASHSSSGDSLLLCYYCFQFADQMAQGV